VNAFYAPAPLPLPGRRLARESEEEEALLLLWRRVLPSSTSWKGENCFPRERERTDADGPARRAPTPKEREKSEFIDSSPGGDGGSLVPVLAACVYTTIEARSRLGADFSSSVLAAAATSAPFAVTFS